MMLALEGEPRIFAYGRPVDMRKSFLGLTAMVRHALEEDPLSGNLFVFVNRRGTYVKILRWDRTGFCLFAKRLERGKFRFPFEAEKQELRVQMLNLLLDGIELGRRRRIR